jgi:hypothetical protein
LKKKMPDMILWEKVLKLIEEMKSLTPYHAPRRETHCVIGGKEWLIARRSGLGIFPGTNCDMPEEYQSQC